MLQTIPQWIAAFSSPKSQWLHNPKVGRLIGEVISAPYFDRILCSCMSKRNGDTEETAKEQVDEGRKALVLAKSQSPSAIAKQEK